MQVNSDEAEISAFGFKERQKGKTKQGQTEGPRVVVRRRITQLSPTTTYQPPHDLSVSPFQII